MEFTMKKILEKYDDCDMFSLIGNIYKNELDDITGMFKVEYKIDEKEFDNALNEIRNADKEYLRNEYEKFKDNLIDYPDFESIYSDIEKECYEFYDTQSEPYFETFHCSFIIDKVGKTTKYGKEHTGFFRVFYDKISYNVDREKGKKHNCIKDAKNPLDQVPKELMNSFLRYEISFTSPVNIGKMPMIIYYFRLTNESKEYLLKFKTDFDLKGLEDLSLYKNNEVMFYSCTHEMFNSIMKM